MVGGWGRGARGAGPGWGWVPSVGQAQGGPLMARPSSTWTASSLGADLGFLGGSSRERVQLAASPPLSPSLCSSSTDRW